MSRGRSREDEIWEHVQDKLADNDEEYLEDLISEGEGDDIDQIEPPIRHDTEFPTTIVVAGLPKIPKEKVAKLKSHIEKALTKQGEMVSMVMPLSEDTGETFGVAFATYNTAAEAQKAAETLNGVKLDKTYTYRVSKIDDFHEIVERPEEFQPKKTLTRFSRTEFRDWLVDKKFREQFLLRYQQETEIYWHDAMVGQPVLNYGGEREKRNKKIWCDWRVQWSPCGSYLATFHQPGIALWAGPDFEKKMRFAHEAVKYIEFSPNEEYVLTWNGKHPTENDTSAVRIFNVLTGKEVKRCRTPICAPLGGEFPHFLWSHDGKYFAECNDTSISVRDTETFELVQDENGKKKSFKYENLSTFQWSPKSNIMSVWCVEKDNNPARLVLVEVPSRREIASRSRTQVEASMHWQSEGDYLCLLATKLSKTKKKGVTNLEIFRMKEKDIPMDLVEVKDTVRVFQWETKGSRFAVLTTDDAGTIPKLLIYELGREKCVKISETNLPSNSFNSIHWSPEGQYFVCAAIGQSSSGDLLFGGLTADNKLEINNKEEHFMLTDVQWDPSGRYVITAVTQPMQNDMSFKYSMEAGYAIWTFQGRQLFRQQKEKLWQVMWRPHPPSLLNPDRQNDIKKNIKAFSKRYDAVDEQAKEVARKKFREERDSKINAFQRVLDRLEEHKADMEEETGWQEAWEAMEADKCWEESTSTLEEEIGVEEKLLES
jgi:translation initiation factor 3 subunit B